MGLVLSRRRPWMTFHVTSLPGSTRMKAEDVTHTLELALTASGCDQARVVHKPRLLSDNGPNPLQSVDVVYERKVTPVAWSGRMGAEISGG